MGRWARGGRQQERQAWGEGRGEGDNRRGRHGAVGEGRATTGEVRMVTVSDVGGLGGWYGQQWQGGWWAR